MFMRKVGASLAAVALSMTLFAGVALAETPATPPPNTTMPQPAPTEPEWAAELKAKLDTIGQLRKEAGTLEAQLKQQSEANKALLKQLQQIIAGTLGQQLKDLDAQLKAAYTTNIQPLREQMKSLEAEYQAAKAAKDEAAIKVLRARMADLKVTMAAELAKLQPLRDQIKQLQEQVKARREAVKAIQTNLQPLYDQEKALYARNKELAGQAKTAMAAAEAAKKAGDWSAVLSSLDSVIALRQQANANLQQIATLKTQIGAGLQAAIDAQKK